MVDLAPKSAEDLIARAATVGINAKEAVLARRIIPSLEAAAKIERARKPLAGRKSAALAADAAQAEIRHSDAIRKAKFTKRIDAKSKLRRLQIARAANIISTANKAILESHEHRADLMRTKAAERRQMRAIAAYRRDRAQS